MASCPRKEVSHGSGNPTVRSVGLKAKKGAVRATGGRVGYPDPRMGYSRRSFTCDVGNSERRGHPYPWGPHGSISATLGRLLPIHCWRSGLYKQLACLGCCDIQLFCCRCHCSSPSLEVLEMPTLGLMQLKSYLKKLEARKFISLSTWELWRRWLSY